MIVLSRGLLAEPGLLADSGLRPCRQSIADFSIVGGCPIPPVQCGEGVLRLRGAYIWSRSRVTELYLLSQPAAQFRRWWGAARARPRWWSPALLRVSLSTV